MEKDGEDLGGAVMEDNRNGYIEIDISKLKHKPNPVPSQEALKDVIPIDWPEDVLTGKKKVIVTDVYPLEDCKTGLILTYKDTPPKESEVKKE